MRVRTGAALLTAAALAISAPTAAIAKHTPCGKNKPAHANCGKHKGKKHYVRLGRARRAATHGRGGAVYQPARGRSHESARRGRGTLEGPAPSARAEGTGGGGTPLPRRESRPLASGQEAGRAAGARSFAHVW